MFPCRKCFLKIQVGKLNFQPFQPLGVEGCCFSPLAPAPVCWASHVVCWAQETPKERETICLNWNASNRPPNTNLNHQPLTEAVLIHKCLIITIVLQRKRVVGAHFFPLGHQLLLTWSTPVLTCTYDSPTPWKFNSEFTPFKILDPAESIVV